MIQRSSPILEVIKEDSSLDDEELLINGAAFGEMDTELIGSGAAFFQDTVVDVHDLTDDVLIGVQDGVFSGFAGFEDTQNRAEETELEALSGNSVDYVTSRVLDIEFLATAQTSGRPAGMPARPFSLTNILTTLIDRDFRLAETDESVLADRNLVGSVRGGNCDLGDFVLVFVFSEGLAAEETEAGALLFNNSTNRVVGTRELGVTGVNFVFVSFFVAGDDF